MTTTSSDIRRHDMPGLDTTAFPYTPMITDGTYAFLSGVVASDVPGGQSTHGDIAAETRLCMDAIRAALASIGVAMERIVRVDVHITDLSRMPELNRVYRSYFPEGRLPTRTCTQTGALSGGSNVEITVMARLT